MACRLVFLFLNHLLCLGCVEDRVVSCTSPEQPLDPLYISAPPDMSPTKVGSSVNMKLAFSGWRLMQS